MRGNDLKLCGLMIDAHKLWSPFDHFVRAGQLDTAFLYARRIELLMVDIQERLNDMKYREDNKV
jgi:hypothetical protein